MMQKNGVEALRATPLSSRAEIDGLANIVSLLYSYSHDSVRSFFAYRLQTSLRQAENVCTVTLAVGC